MSSTTPGSWSSGEGTRRMISLDRAGMESRFPGLLDAVLGAPDPEAVSET